MKLSGEQCISLTWILPQKSLTILLPWVSFLSLDSLALLLRFLGFANASSCLDADIRELVSVEDVMEELKCGPNDGLMRCMKYPFLLP